jgi:predicted dehydrogenase
VTTVNRRVFLGSLAAGAAVLRSRHARAQSKEPVKLGLIGCGWYGGVVLDAAFKAGDVEVVGVCDVDSDRLEKTAQKYAAQQQGRVPKTFKSWRELLDASGVQALVIATPPHWHALPFIEACRRGLDIYCEKPLAYDVREGRAMVDAAKASGRVVQIGFQRRQSGAVKQAARYIAEGHPGRILAVEAQINYSPRLADPTPKTPPPSLDWDAWCGPAPKLPYSEQVGHFNWRLEKAYGNGHLVDWGIHWIDAVRTVLGLGVPRTIQAAGGLYALEGRITTPDVLTAHFDFAQCPVTWRHRMIGSPEYTPETAIGMFFYGEKETIFLNDSRFVVVPAGKDAQKRVVEASNDQQADHVGEFLDAVRTRGKVSCPPEDGYRSTSTVQLAMIALESGGRLEWDAQTEQVQENPKANALLKRAYREPFKHPYSAT